MPIGARCWHHDSCPRVSRRRRAKGKPMDSSGIHIRDHITVSQKLIDELKRSKATDLVLVARNINVGDDGVLDLTGHNLFLVADRITPRRDATLNVLARPLPPVIQVPGSTTPGTGATGKTGNAGPAVTIYCKDFGAIKVSSAGAKGGSGARGLTGADSTEGCTREPKQGNSGPKLVCEPPTPSPTGKRGGTGGAGGAGGLITLHHVTRASAAVLRGIGGDPGNGGPGGHGGKITRVITQTSNGQTTTTTSGTDRAGNVGSQGLAGARGADVAPRFEPVADIDAVYARVRGLLGGQIALRWARHRLRQGEHHFRTGNPGPAIDEFDAVLALLKGAAPAPAELLELSVADMLVQAQRLRDFAINGQNIFGMPRRLQLVPHVENMLADLKPYASLPLLLKQDTLTRLLHATDAARLASFIGTQRDALLRSVAADGSLTLELTYAQNAATEADRAKDEHIERARRLREDLEALQDEVDKEQEQGTDGDMILPGLRATKVFAIVAATILTVALPPAAVGVAGLVVSAVVPQLPDLLLGEGGPAEQSLQALAQSGTAFASQINDRLQELENSASGLRGYAEKYADFFSAQLQANGGDAKKALDALKGRLKKDFSADISAARDFALDFKKLQGDLQSMQVGPNKPAQTAYIAKARELAAVAREGQAALVAASQATLALQAASARKSEVTTHADDLSALIGAVNGDTITLRDATARTLARAQRTLSLLCQFQFRLVRALDLYTLASERGAERFRLQPRALRVPYNAGHVEPDLLLDYTESAPTDTEIADRLLEAIDNGFDDGDLTLEVTARAQAYRDELGGRLGGVSHSVLLDDAALKAFKTKGAVSLAIPLDAIPFTYEAKVQNVELIIDGMPEAANDPSTLNIEIVRRGSAQQRWHPTRKLEPATVTEVLLPGPAFSGRDNLTLRRAGAQGDAARQFGGASHVDETTGEKIALQCFGRGVAGEWQLRLSKPSLAADLPRVAGVARVELIVLYGAWVDETAVVVQALTLSPVVAADGTIVATVTLAFPVVGQPARVALSSSAPGFVKAPAFVDVPVGARSATFPVRVDAASTTKSMVPRLYAKGANVRGAALVSGRRQPSAATETVS
jgi:hypothetical protein